MAWANEKLRQKIFQEITEQEKADFRKIWGQWTPRPWTREVQGTYGKIPMIHEVQNPMMGKPRAATAVEVIHASRDPMASVSRGQYALAHEEVVATANELLQTHATLLLSNDVIHQMFHMAKIMPHLSPLSTSVLPLSIAISRGVTLVPLHGGHAGFFISEYSSNIKEKMMLPLSPIPSFMSTYWPDLELVAPGEVTYSAKAHNLLRWQVSFTTYISQLISDLQEIDNNEAVCFPVFTPCVFGIKSITGKSDKAVRADAWALILMQWDSELQLMVLSLPSGGDLEYVPVPGHDVPLHEGVKSFLNSAFVALGNALLSDEDRYHIKNSGTGLTRLMERYWEYELRYIGAPHDLETLKSLTVAAVAFANHDEKTAGMERIR